ncbi:lipopolysaccharide biosynthesis protein [Pontibacter burrus]|uniref:Lipopolysaccharide biosynthesis protein n=1 Tax=Pontibacter burrus TaxID=2704466 RepID=A0A6B3LTL7_9BACT|nr:lipopolysaccharide biosynthesis protein [Pontibacter burrus]NEM99173.1 lipopolysaccharide biosynthesis protein [Pontibacter burrus]
MSDNLASKAVNGIKWGSASTIANAVMQIGYTAIMARLLTPEAFGLVALAGVVLRFGAYFANLGLNKAIVQREELLPEHVRAAFTSSVLLGLLFTGITWVAAPAAAAFFQNEEAIPVIRVMAFMFLINGLSSTAVSMMERNMQFKALSILETVSYILAYLGVGIILAYLDFGVWALVFASLSQFFFVSIGAYAVVRHNIIFLFNWQAYKPLFAYGSRMSLISFLEFLSINVDTILIGRFLGEYRLGIYSRSRELVSQPMHMLTRMLIKVVFPSFSKMQSDNEKLGKAYSSSITLLAAVIIPICLGIMVAAPEIVYVLLGEQWEAAIPVLQILCLGIPLNFLTMFAGIICDAKAILNIKIVLNIVLMAVIALFFYVLKDFGLIGFAWAVVLSELVKMGFYQRVMKNALEITYRQQLQAYLPGLVNGALAAVAIYMVTSLLHNFNLPVIVLLISQIATGAIVLGVATLFFPHRLLRAEIGKLLSKMGLSEDSGSYYGRMINRYKTFIIK